MEIVMQNITTPNAPAAIGPYSQAVVTGNMVYTSGQIPALPKNGEIVGEDIVTQAKQTCENVKAVLEAAGSDIRLVVKTTCYLTDMADFADFNHVYHKYFIHNPARSCVAVKQLPRDVLCEIEAVAILG